MVIRVRVGPEGEAFITVSVALKEKEEISLSLTTPSPLCIMALVLAWVAEKSDIWHRVHSLHSQEGLI